MQRCKEKAWTTGSCYHVLPKYRSLYAFYLLCYSFLDSSSYSPDNGGNNYTSNAMYYSRVYEIDK